MKKTILLCLAMLCVLTNMVRAELTQTIDNAVRGTGPDQHSYVGASWVHATYPQGFSDNTFSYSNVAGAYVTCTFTGTSVDWYTEKLNTHGIAAVSIDGGPETMVDLYASIRWWGSVYSAAGLPLGTHTIKIRITGTKNPASTGTYVVHDGLLIKQPSPPIPDLTYTFAGERSGENKTSRFSYNTGFGYFTLNNVGVQFPGFYNTAVGSQTMTFAAGNYNTAVGHAALQWGGPTSRNTAVGAFALQTVYGKATAYQGDNNTAVGYGAGPVLFPQLTNATALGFNAVATASNQVRLGNADVTSIGGQVSWSTLSDGRFKKDLREDVSGLAFVNSLRPVSYLIDKTSLQNFLEIPDSLRQMSAGAKEKPFRQTGFVAQEVAAVVKKSGYVFNGVDVPKNDKDPYSIRYAEFVVPLVKAVQELSVKNDQLLQQNTEQQTQIEQLLEKIDKVERGDLGSKSSEIFLLQNNPNPFSTNSEIKMILPETVLNARIIIYNLEGKQLKDIAVKDRGNASVTVQGSELNAGMYIYTLIADGKVIDTKRMVLTN